MRLIAEVSGITVVSVEAETVDRARRFKMCLGLEMPARCVH